MKLYKIIQPAKGKNQQDAESFISPIFVIMKYPNSDPHHHHDGKKDFECRILEL
jgi:hypothetical protein